MSTLGYLLNTFIVNNADQKLCFLNDQHLPIKLNHNSYNYNIAAVWKKQTKHYYIDIYYLSDKD